jgi:hypothetical protein
MRDKGKISERNFVGRSAAGGLSIDPYPFVYFPDFSTAYRLHNHIEI